jgi:hypothetical protein
VTVAERLRGVSAPERQGCALDLLQRSGLARRASAGLKTTVRLERSRKRALVSTGRLMKAERERLAS